MTASPQAAAPVAPPRPPGVPTNADPAGASRIAGRRWSHRPRAERLEADHDALIAAQTTSLATRSRTVAMVGAKGGVGTTTLTLLTGLLLAEVPGARPVVVELAPDWGTTARLLGDSNPRTAADLLAHMTAAHRDGVGFVQGFMTLWGRLPVLAAPSWSGSAGPLTAADYAPILHLLGIHYNLVLLDCGASVTHPLTRLACHAAHHVVLVAHPDPVAMHRASLVAAYLTGDTDRAEGPLCHQRAAIDLSVAVNGGDGATARPFAAPRWQAVLPQLNAALSLPHSEPLRRRLAAGSLAVETVPTDMRRATKGLLAPILGRLAHP